MVRLGCPFADIREIVQICDECRVPCEHIVELPDKKISEVGAELGRHQLVRRELPELKAVAKHPPRVRQLKLIQLGAD